MNPRDTIVALATPLARSGIGVVRLSGDASRGIAGQILRFAFEPVWQPWRATFAALVSDRDEVVDEVVATYFAAPRSYTTEDMVEIACHGSPVVLRYCVERAVAAGARLAEPGEFTLRAYLHGRIDLPQAEAVHELIEATTLYQARVAAQQLEGSVSRRIRPIKAELVELISLLEAGIDFAEDDISIAADEEILARLTRVETPLVQLARSFQQGKLVFQGATLAIAGRPNVGKSSVFNRLLEVDRAIVTSVPGTTRDTVSESLSLRGIPLKLVDTAGIRESTDMVEALGIERSYRAIADADLALLVFDGSSALTGQDYALLNRLHGLQPLLILNKSDLPPHGDGMDGAVAVSALTGDGMEQLRDAILQRLAPNGLAQPEDGAITSIRHEALLRESIEALQHARRAVEFAIPHEMLLLDLYAALRPLDGVTGATTADDILNRIFSTFCIGK